MFRWTARREEAAVLVAQDGLSNEEIAKRVGISRQGLDKWKRQPGFRERVEALVGSMAESVKGRGIADRQNRVSALNERWDRLWRVVEARAVQYADVPGGDTGMLVGRGVAECAEYVLDGVLLKELREHEKQAAIEVGQWEGDRQDESAVLVREYVGVAVELV